MFAQQNTLGPWIADTVESAEELLVCALAHPFSAGPSVLISAKNEAGQALVQRYGFRETSSSLHTRRGLPVPSMQRAMIYGQESMALG